VGLLLAACSSGGTPARDTNAAELTVFAAASLRGALQEAARVYAAEVPGATLTISTDSSAALAAQIAHGAPADVFLSADTANPQRLVDAGLAAGAPVPFASNRLAVIVPRGNPGRVATPADLARPGLKIIAAGDEVPITAYARRVVARLAAEPGYAVGFEAEYEANVVSKEDNARAIVAKIELGEGDAGIVYATDAAAASSVEVIEIPAEADVRATYAGVVIAGTRHPEAARAFLGWLGGPSGQAILAGFGFLPAGR
jgi:molybdate transport system substrate-binding protein